MHRLLLLIAILVAAYAGYPYLTLYWLDQALLNDDQEADSDDGPVCKTGATIPSLIRG